MHGVMVIDKPAGMTSAAVVSKVKRIFGVKRVGHTGTLDPMATGVLPICVGQGTKVAGYLLAADKAYEGEARLGVQTDTLDAEGNVTKEQLEAAKNVTSEQIIQAMETLTGDIEQRPPMFSAIKHKGKRLHSLARQGLEVERPARPVTVHCFRLVSYSEGRVRFVVECSKGTYVRVLVESLGSLLGCGAHLTSLRRTQSGPFSLAEATSLDDLGAGTPPRLTSLVEALRHLPTIGVPEALVPAIKNGKVLPWSSLDAEGYSKPVILTTPDQKDLLAIVERDAEQICYRRVFTY